MKNAFSAIGRGLDSVFSTFFQVGGFANEYAASVPILGLPLKAVDEVVGYTAENWMAGRHVARQKIAISSMNREVNRLMKRDEPLTEEEVTKIAKKHGIPEASVIELMSHALKQDKEQVAQVAELIDDDEGLLPEA